MARTVATTPGACHAIAAPRSHAMKPSDHGSSRWRSRRSARAVDRPRRRRAGGRQRPDRGAPRGAESDRGRQARWPRARTAGPRRTRSGGRPCRAAGPAPPRPRAPRPPDTKSARAAARSGAALRQPPRHRVAALGRSACEEAPEHHDEQGPDRDGEGQGLGAGDVGAMIMGSPSGSDDIEEYPEERGDQRDEAPEVGAAVQVDPQQPGHRQGSKSGAPPSCAMARRSRISRARIVSIQ